MPQAFVHNLKAVQVQEQNRGNISAALPVPFNTPPQLFNKVWTIGKTGQWIVQGIVAQAVFHGSADGYISNGAAHPHSSTIGITHRQPAHQNPAVLTILVQASVFALKMLG